MPQYECGIRVERSICSSARCDSFRNVATIFFEHCRTRIDPSLAETQSKRNPKPIPPGNSRGKISHGRCSKCEYADPHSKQALQHEDLHRVTIELVDEAQGTRVAVTQDANVSDAALAHAEGGWRLALNNLKGHVELAGRASP
jgi:hypothetical protein